MQTNLFSNPSNSSNSSSGVTGAAVQGSAGSDMFTKLLVAQIKNQDPLAPTDPSQFVNQLSQLSQTEALQNLASLSSSSASVLQSLQALALGAQVGSDVMASTGSVRLGTAKVEGSIALSAASSKTTLVLTGADGLTHNVTLGARDAGSVPFTLDPSALGLAPGNYQMQVQTSSGAQPPIDILGKLASVRLSATGSVVLNVANVGEVAPAALTGFNGKSGATL